MDLDRLARLIRALDSDAPLTTFGSEIARYRAARISEHHLSPAWAQQCTDALADLEAELGHVRIGELTTEMLARWVDRAAPGSRRRVHSIMAACVRWLERHGHPGLAELLPRKPVQRPYTRYMSDEQLRAAWLALDAAQAQRWCRWWMCDLLRVAMLCPLRRGELASLRWCEIDTHGKRLLLHATKTGDRVVPLSPVALALLARQRRSGQYVWAGSKGRGHVHDTSIHHAWVKVLERAGLPHFRFHALRHSWASKALRDGVPMEHVRRVLGHTSEHMAAKYAHLSADEARRSVEMFEQSIVTGQWQMPLGVEVARG